MGKGARTRGCLARDHCGLRAVGGLCAVFSFLYGAIVAASAVPSFRYNAGFAGASVAAGTLLLLCSFVGMIGFMAADKRSCLLFFLISELVLGGGIIAFSYSAANAELAFCRSVHLWQHAALDTRNDPAQPERLVAFWNSTYEIEVPAAGQDFLDSIFHADDEDAHGHGGEPRLLTEEPLEQCDAFFFGKTGGASAIAGVIVVIFLKTILSAFVSLKLVVELVLKEAKGAYGALPDAKEINMVETEL